MSHSVAVFVDGDNICSDHSSNIIRIANSYGSVLLAKAFGDENSLSNWAKSTEFQFVYSGSGKNAADLHLAIEVTELTLTQKVGAVVLCTSDSDFVHLARRLRERGILVIGCGETKAKQIFRSACSEFHLLGVKKQKEPAEISAEIVSEFDLKIRMIIAANSTKGMGMRVADLSPAMYSKHGTKISEYPERTWRGYLGRRKSLFDLDAKGPEAMVRVIPHGFQTADGHCQQLRASALPLQNS